MKPTISIIVPIYNVEPYLHKCIDSIIAQTFTDFELILVNDGSPDKSGEICDEYANKDNRINVIHKENGGVSSARNAGIRAATGQYIGFVDSDDYIHEQMYEILAENAIQHASEIVVCDFQKINIKDTAQTSLTINDPYLKHYTNIEALYQLFSKEPDSFITGAGNSIKWVVLWNKLYKRELFEKLEFEEGRICEDEFIIHKLLFRSKKVTAISSPLYHYVQSHNSIIRSSYSLKRLDKVYALKDRADFFMTIKETNLHYHAYKSYLDSFLWNYFKAKTELNNIRQELKQLKSTFDKSILLLLKNPLIGWKQKTVLVLFVINPFIYELNIKMNKNNIGM